MERHVTASCAPGAGCVRRGEGYHGRDRRTRMDHIHRRRFPHPVRCVVRVRAGDESVARKIVPTVLGAPGTVEIRLANENNAARGHHATVTDVDFSIGSVKPFGARF
jgi:hypothetical protein